MPCLGSVFAALLVPRLLGLLVVAAMILGCSKPDIDECRRACWNYNKVMYWAKVDREVKSMSIEEAAKYRASKEIEFRESEQRVEDQGLMNCIYDCQHISNNPQVACMKNATSEAQLESCME